MRTREGIAFMRLLAAVAVLLVLAIGAFADTIMIGTTSGIVNGRSEFDLGTVIPSTDANWGAGTPITGLAAGVQGDVVIGLGTSTGPNVEVRKYNDMATSLTSVATGNDASAVATLPDGNVLIGDQGNLVFLRDPTNLLVRPSNYTGSTDGGNFNSPITAFAPLSNGNFVVANSIGQVIVRSGTDIFSTPAGAAVGYISYGTPVTALATLPGDLVAVALSTGYVDIRSWDNLAAVVGSGVNFGIKIDSLAALPNGDLAIGLDNGQVAVRQSTDLVNGQVTQATFTSGAGITALAATSNGDLAVGTADNLVFIRQGTDLSQTPVGYSGTDGINFGVPISALTSVVPEPSSLAALAFGLIGLLGFANRKKG